MGGGAEWCWGRGAGPRVLRSDAYLPSVPRIGNLLVPNDNYCKFEDWLMPILDQMVLEQNTEVGLKYSGGPAWWQSGRALLAEADIPS